MCDVWRVTCGGQCVMCDMWYRNVITGPTTSKLPILLWISAVYMETWKISFVKGDVWCVMCDVWCVMCDVWCVMCDVWCVMCDVWCVMCDVWCVMCDVWCVICDVWCVMCDVWCGMSGDACSIAKIILKHFTRQCLSRALEIEEAHYGPSSKVASSVIPTSSFHTMLRT